jgi:non-heme chloroperoxidase
MEKCAKSTRTRALLRTLADRVPRTEVKRMSKITAKNGLTIFFKDWGAGQPIAFSHGWPLSSDDWDAQMMFFLGHGFRVTAHDRRGHGRSSQTADGHDMDHYADDLAALAAHLNLNNAIRVGHSTGGGEVARYIARHGESRVAKAVVLVSAVPPLMVKTASNPGGLPKELFDGFQPQVAESRAQFYLVAFSQTDFTPDLRRIGVPTLVMHGDDDQIVPYADWSPLTARLIKNANLKTCKGFPHGMPNTEAYDQRGPARIHQILAH